MPITSKELLEKLNKNLPQVYESAKERMRKYPELRKNFIDPKTGKLPAWMDPDLPENQK